MLSLVLIPLALLLAILLYKQAQKKYLSIEAFPGPPSHPLIGCSLAFGPNFGKRNLSVFYQWHLHYGRNIRLWPIWLTPTLLTSDPDLIQVILNSTSHLKKGTAYDLLKPWLGEGLLTSFGSKWHKKRKILTPAFHFRILETFVETFDKESNLLLEKIPCGSDPIEIKSIIKLCALDIICKTSMGSTLNAQSGGEITYLKSLEAFLNIVVDREFSLWKNFQPLFRLSFDNIKSQKLIGTMHAFTTSIIEKRKQTLTKNRSEIDQLVEEKKISFLDLLLSKSQAEGLSDIDIREEVDTFLFEGHDTITTAITFILYELAKHPDIQEKIIEEAEDILGDCQKVSLNQLQDLNYLSLVIKEGMRLYPPVALFSREIEEDLVFNGATIPKYCELAINAFALHRDPEIFPEPDSFIPERFLPDNFSKKHAFCYIPFSAGPRNCIGQRFAMLEMKMIIMRILRNYELFPVENHKLDLYTDSILKSQTGTLIKIQKRYG